MRTTLTIDDDVLVAAKAMARQQHRSIGEVVSDLARRTLHRPRPAAARNGIPLLPMSDRQAVVTLDLVNAMRDEAASTFYARLSSDHGSDVDLEAIIRGSRRIDAGPDL